MKLRAHGNVGFLFFFRKGYAFLMRSNGEIIGEVIRKRRKLIGLKQKSLAKFAGITVSALWSIEKKGTCPSADTLISLCRVLGLNIYDFDDVKMEEVKQK